MLAMRECQRRMKSALMLLLARQWIGNPSVPPNPNYSLAFASALISPTTFAFRGDSTLTRGSEPRRPNRNGVHKYSNMYGYGYEHEFKRKRSFHSASTLLFLAKPKKAGSLVDSYQTVSVNCSTCRERLFRYKKKNGTKSNLVKCYVERISDDCAGILARAAEAEANGNASADFNAISSENAPSNDGNRNRWASANNRKRNTKEKQMQMQMQMQIQKQRRHGKHQRQTQTQSQTQPSPEHQSAAVPTSLDPEYSWECPRCHTRFARSSLIHGRPALKMIGGKIRMTKK